MASGSPVRPSRQIIMTSGFGQGLVRLAQQAVAIKRMEAAAAVRAAYPVSRV